MEQTVRFQDGSKVTLQHRASGTFRTSGINESGSASQEFNYGRDSRHVSLYRSPTGHLILADYNARPVIVDLRKGKAPLFIDGPAVEVDFKLSNEWTYLGAVHRTQSNTLAYYPYEEECQVFAAEPRWQISRKVKPCTDSNY